MMQVVEHETTSLMTHIASFTFLSKIRDLDQENNFFFPLKKEEEEEEAAAAAAAATTTKDRFKS
jgi:hypothetical protein